jgi:hypothetical protein
MFKESIRLTMNLKAKRINEGEKYPVLGFVLPLVNPTVVKRNRHVKVAIYGIEKVKSE